MSCLKKYCLPITILFFIVTVGVFGPLELYVTNHGDLWFSFWNTLIISLIMSGVGLLVVGGLAMILPKKFRSIYSAILFALTLCLYVQGNYININYGVLDGKAIDWGAYTGYAIADTLFWIAVFAVVLLIWKKKAELLRSIQTYAGLLIISMQVITLGYLCLTSGILVQEDVNHYLSRDHIYEISENENVIVFVLDAFQESYLQEIFDDDPEKYKTLFKDFTHFTNAAAGAANTGAALPVIVTGEKYPGQISYADYIEQCFDSDGLYSALADNNYNISMYTEYGFVPDNSGDLIANLTSSGFEVKSYLGLTQKYGSFTLYKYMPHILKQFFWLYTGDFDAYREGGDAEVFDINDIVFYDGLMNQKLTTTDEYNAMRLYHMEGAHPPHHINEFAQATENPTIVQQCKGNLYIIEEYINQMKELGVYENAAIIIMADHGQTDPAHGILMVKNPGTQDAFTESAAPVSYFDLHNTIFSYLGEDHGDTFFDISEDLDRQRYFYLQNVEAGKFYMTEYLIEGDMYSSGSGVATGNVFMPTLKEHAYEYFHEISFGTDGNVSPYIVSGFSSTPITHSWTDGYESIMTVPLKSYPYEDLDVYIYMVAVMTDTGPQIINIFANDQLVYETTRSDTTPIVFKIPKELITEDKLLTLRIELPNAVCPAELYGTGNDPRRLGLALTAMYIVDPGRDYGAMAKITGLLGTPLSWLLEKCHNATSNYVLAIFLFTLLTKIILLPVSLWTNKNGIIMIKMMPELNRLKVKYYGDKAVISDETQALYKREKYNPIASSVPMIIQIVLLMGVIGAVKEMLGGVESVLNAVPSETGGITLLMPVLAALAALALGIGQNLLNPLQKEQTKKDQWITNGISIAISLFLGAFVSVGTCVYWIASNLFTIPFQWLMNLMMPPEKYVDYEALEESRKQLQAFEGVGGKKKESYFSENKKREREDYKRFFSVVNKHLVFYSESNGFYKYYKGFIEYLLKYTNLPIHYITSDPNDQIFEMAKTEPRIRGYYIGENKLITLMMKMDADVVVMTMPDLENYHIKRSYVRDDIEYINIPHGMGSNNLTLRTGALDHFDTIFCAGVHQKTENLQTEAAYNLPAKTCVEVGYPLLDEMRAKYNSTAHTSNVRKKILIAPSWQVENIIDSCLEPLLDSLKTTGYEIIVRPHPQEVRLKEEYMKTLKEKYEPQGIEIQTDFTSNNPVLEADILITDWSDISWEYAFTTLRPVMYINTPMKVMNPEWQKIEEIPLNILLRDKLGKSLNTDELHRAAETVEFLLAHSDAYREEIDKLAHEYIYNLDGSSRVGAKYIISAVQKKIAERGKNK